jgi:hypothetical protein
METPLGQAIERVVHAAGELTVEGTKLLFKDSKDREVQVSVLEFDEEAKVFLARRSDLEGEAVKAISPRKFKLGMINNLPSQKMADFLAAWDDQIEPLLREGAEKETLRETEGRTVKTTKVDRVAQKGIRGLSLDEPEEAAKSRKATSERSYHSAASKGRKRERTPEKEESRKRFKEPRAQYALKSRVSGQGDTSEVEERRLERGGRSSGFRFPEGVKTMENFVAYLQPKLGQLPSNPVLVADVQRRYAQVDQAKKGLYQTTGLLIRVYKAPVEWQRVLLLTLVYGMFFVAINGLFGYQQDALLTDGEAICRKAGAPEAKTSTKLEGMETQVRKAFEKRLEKITKAVSKGKLPVNPKRR